VAARRDALIENRDAGEQSAEAPLQRRANVQPQWPPLVLGGLGDVADRVNNRRDREQPGHNREQDRGAHADQPDKSDGEQRPNDGAEVVHRALEAVGAAVGVRGDDVGE
jgi:hypothetical protein